MEPGCTERLKCMPWIFTHTTLAGGNKLAAAMKPASTTHSGRARQKACDDD
jgi:hypothetical protein